MRLLIRRMGAFGDVVLTTPVLRRLRRENPDAEIAVQTAYPGVFRNSPHASFVFQPGVPPYPWTEQGGVSRIVDLDLAYERHPEMHIVEAYMNSAFGDEGDPMDRRQELFFKEGTPLETPFGNGRVVAVHAARAGWRNRTLPEETWLSVVAKLREAGFFLLIVGTMHDALPKAKAASFHATDVLAQAEIISKCACFVGSDSGLLHVAGATDVPIVGVFTCALPRYRLPWRNGSVWWKSEGVLPDLPCIGCLERAPVPATTETCERGDIACVREPLADRIVEAVVRLAR